MTATLQDAGPLLTRLVAAQQLEDEVVSYPRIEQVADGLIARAKQLGDCLIWPVGPAADRATGAATARGCGRIEVASWNSAVAGRRLLLFGVAGVSPLSLAEVAGQLRQRGATEIHGCAVEVVGAAEADCFDSFTSIGAGPTGEARLLVAGVAA